MLLGSESPDWARRSTMAYSEAIPHAEVHILEGHGHGANTSGPELLAAEIARFLAVRVTNSPTCVGPARYRCTMRATTIRFPNDLWEQLEQEARAQGISVAQYVRDAALYRVAYSAGARGRTPARAPAHASPTARAPSPSNLRL